MFGHKIKLEREITSEAGHNTIQIKDVITNFGFEPCPYMILYHMNLGYPLLDEDAELVIDPLKTEPRNTEAESGISDFRSFIKPEKGFKEQVFCHTMKASDNSETSVMLLNKKLNMALQITFSTHQLPYLIQWKMMGSGEYVLGLEPSNVPGKNRVALRNENILPILTPGEIATNIIKVSLLESE